MHERFDTFSSPQPKPDPWQTATENEIPDDGGELDPRAAAALLEQTTAGARRQFEVQPTILIVAAAVTVFVVYGAVWLSVRDQHPYTGPSGTALAVLYGTLALWIVFVTVVLRRALSGRSSRRRQLEGIVFGAIWICVYVFQGAIHHVDPNPAIAYGIYAAAAPLIIVGAAAAAYEAARGKPVRAGFAGAAVVLASFASFAGPADVWAVMGVGLCVLILLGAAAQSWQRRVGA